MKKLFLTSYLAGTKHLVKAFLKGIAKKEILFIDTAANVEEYRGYVDEAKEAFTDMGYQLHVIDIAVMQKEDVVKLLSDCQCLYISGGNTFYLLQELKRKNLIEHINNRISDGMLYIGESAGAVIAAPNIEYSQIMDDKRAAADLTDFNAMTLVDFYVLPHNNEFPFAESTAETIKTYGQILNLLPINNSEAIVVNGENHTILK